MGGRSRRKGADYEREVVRALMDQGFYAVRRQQGRAGSRDGADISATDTWSGLSLAIECKRSRAPLFKAGLLRGLDQALEGSIVDGGYPVVVTRWDRQTTNYAVLTLPSLLEILRRRPGRAEE